MKKTLISIAFLGSMVLSTSMVSATTSVAVVAPKPLPASIKIITPTVKTDLREGTQYSITWESKNIPSDASIIIDIFNGAKSIKSPNNQIAILSASSTSYVWNVESNKNWGVGMVSPLEKVAQFFGIESAYAGVAGNQYTISTRVVNSKGQLATASSPLFTINPALTIPAIKLTSVPTLRVTAENKKLIVTGSANLEIEANTNEDTFIYTGYAQLVDTKGVSSRTNSTSVLFTPVSKVEEQMIDVTSDYTGNKVYKIKAGEKAAFKITLTDDPELMFGGAYKMMLQNFSFVTPNADGTYNYDFTSIVVPTTLSNQIVIVGERGPYISSTNNPVSLDSDVVVSGARFGKTKTENIIYVSGVKKGGIASKDGKTIVIPRSWFTGAFGKSNGTFYDNVQIENPKFGKSNIVYVEVKGAVSLTPQIDTVSSPAAGDFEIDSEGKVFITGTNLVYKDSAEVYIGDQKATITQYGADLMIVQAPKLALGSYDMYLTTGVGKSNIVKVKVITSTGGIDLASTCPTTKFDRDLIVGSTGNDVVALQTFLYTKGYSVSSATGYFGALTKSSLAAYQVAKTITPSDGSFTPLTRAVMTADCFNVLKPKITVLYPNGGQRYVTGGDYDISWSSSDMAFGDAVRIEIYKGGVYVDQVAFNQPQNGVYFWSPSTKLVPGNDYKIRVVRAYDATNSVYDESDDYFTISNPGIDLTSTCPSTKFERDLVVGSSGNDVVAMQTFLYAKGYSVGVATGYFGASTKSSLTAYQVAKGITPSDGSFTPLTRAAMTADCSIVTRSLLPQLVSIESSVNSGTNDNDDFGIFKIKFKVTAVGGDVYISSATNIPQSNQSIITLNKRGVATTGQSVTVNIQDLTDATLTTNGNYKISEGDEAVFEVNVGVQIGSVLTAGLYRVELNSIKWNSDDSINYELYSSGFESFKTSFIELN